MSAPRLPQQYKRAINQHIDLHQWTCWTCPLYYNCLLFNLRAIIIFFYSISEQFLWLVSTTLPISEHEPITTCRLTNLQWIACLQDVREKQSGSEAYFSQQSEFSELLFGTSGGYIVSIINKLTSFTHTVYRFYPCMQQIVILWYEYGPYCIINKWYDLGSLPFPFGIKIHANLALWIYRGFMYVSIVWMHKPHFEEKSKYLALDNSNPY